MRGWEAEREDECCLYLGLDRSGLGVFWLAHSAQKFLIKTKVTKAADWLGGVKARHLITHTEKKKHKFMYTGSIIWQQTCTQMYMQGCIHLPTYPRHPLAHIPHAQTCTHTHTPTHAPTYAHVNGHAHICPCAHTSRITHTHPTTHTQNVHPHKHMHSPPPPHHTHTQSPMHTQCTHIKIIYLHNHPPHTQTQCTYTSTCLHI